MSVRHVDQNILDLIRSLQEEVKSIRATLGATRVNSIRLGNWVLEAEADELVRMTNLATGAVSYVGANQLESAAGMDEVLWSYSGTVAPTSDIAGQLWLAPFKIQIKTLTLTLTSVSTVSLDVVTKINGATLTTSTLPENTASIVINLPTTTLVKGDSLQPTLLSPEAGADGEQLGMAYRYVIVQ